MTIQRCPCCKQIVRSPKEPTQPTRICFDCGNPVLRGHRYTYQERRGETAVVHRVCCNPHSYYRAAKCKELGVVTYKDMIDEEVATLTKVEDDLENKFAQWRKENGKEGYG